MKTLAEVFAEEERGAKTSRATPLILITNLAAISRHETPAKASRQAHRWLRRRVAVVGDWATILDPATGAVCKRYVLRNGRVERAQ